MYNTTPITNIVSNNVSTECVVIWNKQSLKLVLVLFFRPSATAFTPECCQRDLVAFSMAPSLIRKITDVLAFDQVEICLILVSSWFLGANLAETLSQFTQPLKEIDLWCFYCKICSEKNCVHWVLFSFKMGMGLVQSLVYDDRLITFHFVHMQSEQSVTAVVCRYLQWLWFYKNSVAIKLHQWTHNLLLC